MQHISKLLLLAPVFFAACGENTNTPIGPDVKSIQIDKNITEIYATNSTIQLTATVTYEDGTTADVTNGVTWFYPNESNYSVATMLGGNVEAAANDSQDLNISIKYQNLNTDSHKIHLNKLTAIHYDANITTTGEHNISIKGDFDNNETNKILQTHLSWVSDDNNSNFVSYDGNTSTLIIDITGFPTTIIPVMFSTDLSTSNYTYTITGN